VTCNETNNASMIETQNSNNQIVHIWNETSLLNNDNSVKLGRLCHNAVNTSHSGWLGYQHCYRLWPRCLYQGLRISNSLMEGAHWDPTSLTSDVYTNISN